MEKYNAPNSLKGHAVKRIIYDMINDIKSSSGSQDSLIVMIVDDYTVKILSSVVTMSDGIISISVTTFLGLPFGFLVDVSFIC
jgi:hypothetical protein